MPSNEGATRVNLACLTVESLDPHADSKLERGGGKTEVFFPRRLAIFSLWLPHLRLKCFLRKKPICRSSFFQEARRKRGRSTVPQQGRRGGTAAAEYFSLRSNEVGGGRSVGVRRAASAPFSRRRLCLPLLLHHTAFFRASTTLLPLCCCFPSPLPPVLPVPFRGIVKFHCHSRCVYLGRKDTVRLFSLCFAFPTDLKKVFVSAGMCPGFKVRIYVFHPALSFFSRRLKTL